MTDFLSMPNDKVDVYIRISKQGSRYTAHVFAQHKVEKGEETELMKTSEPLSRMLLKQLLESFGFRQRVVFDALDGAETAPVVIKHPLW